MFDSFSANAILAFIPELAYDLPYYGLVSFQQPAAFLVIFLALILFFWFLRQVLLHRLRSIAVRIPSKFDDTLIDALQNIKGWVFSLVALFAALQVYELPLLIDKIATGIFYFVIAWQVIDIVTRMLDYFTTSFLERGSEEDGEIDPNAKTASHMITLIARVALWVFGVLFVLSNLGIEVTSLIAGLGIGGVAIAFAMQGVLSDLFASLSIYMDKPFRIGDFVVIGTDKGTVEKIGIKTTRIRTLQGEELVVSNAELTTVRVQNFKKMQRRRVATQFGVTYETPQERLNEIPGIVERIFESLEGATLDRVHFASFGDFALIFELVYHVESSEYNSFMDIQQAFNFDLMERFAELGIEFAYPTQTIYTKAVS